jgi:hypothetical protein
MAVYCTRGLEADPAAFNSRTELAVKIVDNPEL